MNSSWVVSLTTSAACRRLIGQSLFALKRECKSCYLQENITFSSLCSVSKQRWQPFLSHTWKARFAYFGLFFKMLTFRLLSHLLQRYFFVPCVTINTSWDRQQQRSSFWLSSWESWESLRGPQYSAGLHEEVPYCSFFLPKEYLLCLMTENHCLCLDMHAHMACGSFTPVTDLS